MGKRGGVEKLWRKREIERDYGWWLCQAVYLKEYGRISNISLVVNFQFWAIPFWTKPMFGFYNFSPNLQIFFFNFALFCAARF
jgi:hypothetical protein